MKTWVIGGALVVAVAGGVYFTRPVGTAVVPMCPVCRSEPVPAIAGPSPAPPAPAVLATVVDVTDIDPLLDPPPIPVSEAPAAAGPTLTAVGYDELPPAPARPASAVKPIPLADDNASPAAEVAPMPREANRRGHRRDVVNPQGRRRTRIRVQSVVTEWDAAFAEFRPTQSGFLFLDSPVIAHEVYAIRRPLNYIGSGRISDVERDEVYERLLSVPWLDNGYTKFCDRNPLLMSLWVLDMVILKQRHEKGILGAGTDTDGKPSRPSSRWLAKPTYWSDETELSGPPGDPRRQIYALFSPALQAPSTRIEWYTRWYGSARFFGRAPDLLPAGHPISERAYGLLTATDVRDELYREPKRTEGSTFFFGCPGLFAGN